MNFKLIIKIIVFSCIMISGSYVKADINDDLIQACELGDLNKIKKSLKNGADINIIKERTEKDEVYKVSPLYIAVWEGYFNIIKYLIANGADVNKAVPRGTPLHFAVQEGNLFLVKYLINKKADVHVRDQYQKTPLFYAADTGDLYILQYLLEKGADVNARDHLNYTPLYYAVIKNHLATVKHLVKKSADIKTPYMDLIEIAREKGYQDMVKYLKSVEAK